MTGTAEIENLRGAVVGRASHIERDEIAFVLGRDHAGLGFEAQRRGFFRHETGGVAREATGAIAAHFGLAAIGVIVAHAEVGLAIGGFDGEQSISSHAAMAVAEAGDGFSIQ